MTKSCSLSTSYIRLPSIPSCPTRHNSMDSLTITKLQLPPPVFKFSSMKNLQLAARGPPMDSTAGILALPKKPNEPFGLPALLSIASDQQSVQFCAVAFLENRLQLNLVHWPAPFHMSLYDITASCSRAGLQPTVRASMTVFILSPIHL